MEIRDERRSVTRMDTVTAGSSVGLSGRDGFPYMRHHLFIYLKKTVGLRKSSGVVMHCRACSEPALVIVGGLIIFWSW